MELGWISWVEQAGDGRGTGSGHFSPLMRSMMVLDVHGIFHRYAG
jgi:hypothetical protein